MDSNKIKIDKAVINFKQKINLMGEIVKNMMISII